MPRFQPYLGNSDLEIFIFQRPVDSVAQLWLEPIALVVNDALETGRLELES